VIDCDIDNRDANLLYGIIYLTALTEYCNWAAPNMATCKDRMIVFTNIDPNNLRVGLNLAIFQKIGNKHKSADSCNT